MLSRALAECCKNTKFLFYIYVSLDSMAYLNQSWITNLLDHVCPNLFQIGQI